MDISRTVEARIQASLLKFERRVRAAHGGASADDSSQRGERSMRIDDLVRDAQDRAGVPADRTRIAADTVDFKRVIQEATKVGKGAVPVFGVPSRPPALAIALAVRAYAAAVQTPTNKGALDIRI